jgi:hypothetical protein
MVLLLYGYCTMYNKRSAKALQMLFKSDYWLLEKPVEVEMISP